MLGCSIHSDYTVLRIRTTCPITVHYLYTPFAAGYHHLVWFTTFLPHGSPAPPLTAYRPAHTFYLPWFCYLSPHIAVRLYCLVTTGCIPLVVRYLPPLPLPPRCHYLHTRPTITGSSALLRHTRWMQFTFGSSFPHGSIRTTLPRGRIHTTGSAVTPPHCAGCVPTFYLPYLWLRRFYRAFTTPRAAARTLHWVPAQVTTFTWVIYRVLVTLRLHAPLRSLVRPYAFTRLVGLCRRFHYLRWFAHPPHALPMPRTAFILRICSTHARLGYLLFGCVPGSGSYATYPLPGSHYLATPGWLFMRSYKFVIPDLVLLRFACIPPAATLPACVGCTAGSFSRAHTPHTHHRPTHPPPLYTHTHTRTTPHACRTFALPHLVHSVYPFATLVPFCLPVLLFTCTRAHHHVRIYTFAYLPSPHTVAHAHRYRYAPRAPHAAFPPQLPTFCWTLLRPLLPAFSHALRYRFGCAFLRPF